MVDQDHIAELILANEFFASNPDIPDDNKSMTRAACFAHSATALNDLYHRLEDLIAALGKRGLQEVMREDGHYDIDAVRP